MKGNIDAIALFLILLLIIMIVGTVLGFLAFVGVI